MASASTWSGSNARRRAGGSGGRAMTLTSGLSCNHVGTRSTDRDSLRLLSNLPGNDAYLWHLTHRTPTVQGREQHHLL